jgi:hypothetical protein
MGEAEGERLTNLIASFRSLHEDVSLTGKSGKGELRRVVK